VTEQPLSLHYPLERFLVSENFFGLTTASPLQRAVCKIIDGAPLRALASDADVVAALGGASAVALLPATRPNEVLILAAIRSAKSIIAAATAIRASQTVPIEHLGPGEIPRVAIVSLTLDLAQVVFRYVVGTMEARPHLARLLVGKPTSDSVLVKHPSGPGRYVEIKVSPLASAGSSLVARWLAGVIFDEAPRMAGQEDGVRNLTDARAAAIGRLLPGAQMITIGSLWAPFGPVYELVQEHFGKPSPRIVVVRGTGPAMNPVWWTPERCERLRQSDPVAYRTDVLGEFTDPESALLGAIELDAVTRAEPPELPREEGLEYAAATDPATRGNAWTLVIATRKRVPGQAHRTKQIIACARQWVGNKTAPLSPDRVLAEIAAVCKPYGIDTVTTDQFAADALRDIADRHGLVLRVETITAARKVELYGDLATKVAEGDVELPPNAVLRSDLLSIRKRVTQAGITFELPKTSDGRHADFAPAVALALAQHVDAPAVEEGAGKPRFGTREYWRFVASPDYQNARAREVEEREAEETASRVEQRWQQKWDGTDWWENG
jgi:hypothetical protein